MTRKTIGLLSQKNLKIKTDLLDNSLPLYKTFLFASAFIVMSSGFSETNNVSKAEAIVPTIEQHPPHEHGVANLTIAIDANNIEIDLESPADNIFGFEYSPSTEADKKKLRDAVNQLKAANILFTIPEAAQCHLDQVNVSSAMLESLHATPDSGNESNNKGKSNKHLHNDVDASWYYSCKYGEKIDQITPHFFFVFSSGFKQLKVEWLTPSGVSSSLITEDKTIKFKGSTE